jgi:anti-sigma factor RsiW
MRCDRIKELIVDYIDGEVDGALREEIARHLKGCPDCGRMEQSLRSLSVEPLRSAQRLQAPAELWQRVRDSIERKRRPHVAPFPAVRWIDIALARRPAFALAAVVVIVLGAAFLFERTMTSRTSVESYIEEGALFLSQLERGADIEYPDTDDVDLGTSIESYLL